jgi:hypothetical protein
MRLMFSLLVLLLGARTAIAQNALAISEVRTDRATLHTVGIQVLISGDANHNARIDARVRIAGESIYRDAPTLFRVRPETVTTRTVPEQFAGTIFDLAPGTAYEIELVAMDPDGGSETRPLMAMTRAWPRDPTTPRAIAAANETELRDALQNALAGDVITIADGTYTGTFTLDASGMASAPIVLRGASRDGVIFDGQNCATCNVIEIYGSHVHVERLTIRSGFRALRFLGATAGNAVVGVKIEDVVHGISSAPGQADFTICDNIVHGRLQWPLIYSDDNGDHADDQGIRVDGSGHVVCHNDIAGFGDPMINFAEGARAYDFYGNDIHEIYADGTELDRAEGNVRLWGNRFTNVYTAISMQPIYGGPAYVLRNVALNVADEQVKLKSVGGTVEPSGALIFHNTFISPVHALNLQTDITQHNFVIANNLFVGPTSPNARNVDWTAAIDNGVFDANGYFPDAGYWFGTVGTARLFATLAEAQAANIERNGRVLTAPMFADALSPPATYMTEVSRADFALAATSNAVDAAQPLAGINSRHLDTAGDLGARERGCPAPHYGPRPAGSELITNSVNCGADDPVFGDDAGVDPGTNPPAKDGGCCQAPRDARATWLLVIVVGLGLRRRRREPAQPQR